MNCQDCTQIPSFLCQCSNIFYCKAHFSDHLLTPGNHRFDRLFITLSQFEKTKLELELTKRLSNLNHLKKSLTIITENLINQIQNQYQKQIKSINEMMKNYKRTKNQKEFKTSEIEEIKNLIKTEMIIFKPCAEELTSEITSFYSKILTKIEPNPLSEKLILTQNFLKTHNGGFFCLALSNDEKTLITGSEDTTVRVWDLTQMKQMACLVEHSAPVNCLALSDDKTCALSGSFDRKMILWDLKEYSLKNRFFGHQGPICSVNFCRYQGTALSASRVKEIFLWDLQSGSVIKRIITGDNIYHGIVSENNFIVATNMFVEIWDLDSYKKTHSFQAHSQRILSLSMTSNKSFIITGSEDKLVNVWYSKTQFASLQGHKGPVRSVSGTSNEDLILSCSEDLLIILWSLSLKTSIHVFANHSGPVYGIKSFNDQIISVSQDSFISISSLSSKKCERYFSLKPFRVNSEIITEKIVAYAYLNDVIIEDFMQVEFQRVLKGHLNPVGVLCLSSKKNFLISTSSGGKKNLIVWDLQEFSIRNELIGHEYSVLCVDISKDDLIAVSGDKSGQLMLWDLQDYSLLRVFKGHSGQILTIKISGNKKYAVSAGFDKIVYIWNILSNCLHAKLIGHLEIIWKVSFTLDNLFVVSADNYHGIHVWNIENKTSVLQINSLNEANLWLERNKEIKADFIKYLS